MKLRRRKDTGDNYRAYLHKRAAEDGMHNPSDEQLRRFNRPRKGKRMPNDDWTSPADPDSRISQRKGRQDRPGLQSRGHRRSGVRPGAGR